MRNFFIKAIHLAFSAFIFSLTGCGGGGGGVGGGDDGFRTPQVPNVAQIPNAFSRSQYQAVLPALNATTNYAPDAEFNAHHGLGQINADAAYRRGYFGQNATIAIIEQGFYAEHPDLRDNMITLAQNLVGVQSGKFGERGVNHPDSRNSLARASDNIHGTYVALLAAGVRGGNGGGVVVLEDGMESLETLKNTHGVAPSARIIPIRDGFDNTGTRDTFSLAIASDAHIINSSFGIPAGNLWFRRKNSDGSYRDGIWLAARGLPPFAPFLASSRHSSLRSEFQQLSNDLRNKDMVFVWAGGNDGWNSAHPRRLCGKNFAAEEGCRLSQALNSGDFDTEFSSAEFFRDFDAVDLLHNDGGEITATVTAFSLSAVWDESNGAPVATVNGSVIYADLNDPGGWANAPLFAEDLIGKWLVVGSVDEDNAISDFSNGCGVAKNWCLVAPGSNLSILTDIKQNPAGSSRQGRRESIGGTSFSAPIASGALAVLKSRMPEMPMEVVLAALLTSATPLGTRASIDFDAGEEDIPDDIYGWGLINLSAAINLQGTVTLVSVQASSAQSSRLLSGGAVLPSHFANLPANLNGAKAAFGGVGGAYFNAPLEKMIAAESESFALGDAARRMLPSAVGEIRDGALFAARDSENGHILHLGAAAGDWQLRRDFAAADATRFRSAFSDSAAPFFAVTEDLFVLEMRGKGVRPFAAFGGGDAPYRQFGLRWQGGEKVSAIAEAAALSESRTVLGADFGALGGARANSAAGRIGVRGGFGQWRGFADYAVLHSDASAVNGLLRGFSDLRAQEWTAGIAAQNVFGADEIRFAYRRPPFLSGRAHFRFVSAEGSFADAFYNKKPQTLAAQNFAADLSGRAADIVSIGYARRLQQKTNFAIAAEHDLTSGNSALSAFLRTRF